MGHPCTSSHALGGDEEQTAEARLAAKDIDLLELGTEFSTLQLRLRTLYNTQARRWPGARWTPELEARWSRKLNPIRDRIAELEWAAVGCRASSLAELKIKATILQDLVDDNPGDVSAQLTLSLCRDLLAAH